MLLTADVNKKFDSGASVDAMLEIPEGSLITILFGRSGAGKTTVLRCIAGLEKLTSGRVVFGREVWADTKTRVNVPPQKRPIGYLFQEYALFPHLRVRQNIAFGVGRDNDRVHHVAEMLQVSELLDRWPNELSGGQQQRVALARVLARRPSLLLLDEPMSALDASSREHVRTELARLLQRLRIPAIVVTHNWVDALTLGDQLVVMNGGRILQTGPPHDVFMHPQHRDVAAVAGVETIAVGHVKKREAGVVTLEVGSSELIATDSGSTDSNFYVCIRGEDVTLQKGRAEHSSARNHLPAVIVEILPVGVLTKVVLNAGFELVAVVTRQAVADLGLTGGAEIFAVFKASAVHLIPRTSAQT